MTQSSTIAKQRTPTSGWIQPSGNGYCDDFASEMGASDADTLARVSGGQWMERTEVFGLVAEALAEFVDGQDES